MSMFRIFDTAGSAMNAQSLRLNTTASNLANAESVSGDPNKVYRARHPMFATAMQEAAGAGESHAAGVRVLGIVESQAPLTVQHRPEHPEADENGNVYLSNVNAVEEMVNMMSASRSYQNNIEILKTTRDLMLQTLQLGR
ncbi:flagellar basal body rod protein FlgC [Lentisalinibacter orientalis]|uniref:flagellar basal body rod protein FlgC n=1 Tax=Lentisalinibacter orientalis TaxID=2992241 RepID=UPI00386702F4